MRLGCPGFLGKSDFDFAGVTFLVLFTPVPGAFRFGVVTPLASEPPRSASDLTFLTLLTPVEAGITGGAGGRKGCAVRLLPLVTKGFASGVEVVVPPLGTTAIEPP